MAGENAATATPTAQTSAPAIQPAANQGEATSQASAASAPGTEQTQSQSKPLTAPLVKDPMALLNRFRERVGIKTSESAKLAASWSSSGSEKPAADAAPQATANTNAQAAEPRTTEAEAGATTTPSTSSTSATDEPADEFAARVAKLSRTERELSQRQAAFEQEKARAKAEREEATRQHEAKLKQADTMERAAKAIEAGDAVGAVKILKGDMNPSAFALQLLEQLQLNDERPMSQAEVQRMVAEQLKADQEAREKAEEERKKTEAEKQKAEDAKVLDSARDSFLEACAEAFKASRDKYPFMDRRKTDKTEIFKFVESRVDERGRMIVPDMKEVFDHFEAKYRKEAEDAGWVPKTAEAPKPAPSPSLNPSSLVQDSGGRLTNPPNPQSLEAKREERKRRLRMLVQKS